MKNKLIIDTNAKKNPLGDLYGIFFEDLNHAADGGLYAEMVRNRSFEFSPIDNPAYRALTSWNIVGRASVSVSDKDPYSRKNPHYAVIANPCDIEGGLLNFGYNNGFNFIAGEEYIFSCLARSEKKLTLFVSFRSIDGKIYTEKEIEVDSPSWKKYSVALSPDVTDRCGRLLVTIRQKGKICVDFISLFPKNTYKNRENGLRKDIASLLADMKPKFMRFPGGCLIHDGSLNSDDRDSTYRWKNTIGSIYDRPSRRSNWSYNQSLGLGYYEYFQFCEDIGAKPIPVLPAGYNPHSGQGVPFDELGEWIDEALDLIEFARGDVNTKWGHIRAELGHKEPFGLEYIGIGNEEVGEGFFERYPYFHNAIREKYPDIKIINSASPFAAGGEYDRGWKSAEGCGSDIIDEHYYMSPEWFLANIGRYDDFGKRKTKVFLGEYASWGNTYFNALAEAAYMTALENNSDSVALACYAPLLSNIDYTNWKPDMIWFDNYRAFGSANYYVQKMFMNNLGTHLLELSTEGLDKTQCLSREKLSGGIRFSADRCSSEISNITITDNESEKVYEYDDVSLDPAASKDICNIDSGNYSIEFKLKRTGGSQGIRVYFGETDRGNNHFLTLGGWANEDIQISSTINGRGSCLSQYVFSLITGLEYNIRLCVNGRNMVCYVNDEKAVEVYDKPVIVKELYTTAAVDEESGDIIVKAVNVMESECVCDMSFSGLKRISGCAQSLYGYEKEDENTFEEPTKIYPVETAISSDTNTLTYTFPPMSVTIFRIKEN